MTRRRQRARSNAQVAIKAPKEDYLAFDSGNDSPPAEDTKPWTEEIKAHHCVESIKAWKFYQACVLERCHWNLDRRRRIIAEDYSHRIAEVCLRSSPVDIAERISELQTAMAEELIQVDEEERIADNMFRANIKALEEGKAMEDLELINQRMTFDQVSEFIVKYTSTGDVESEREKETMNWSFSSATSSEDSGLLLSDQVGGFGLLTDDIWKPDGEIFNGSFSVDQFYQPPLASILTAAEGPSLEIQTAAHQPSIEDEDSAIKAVLYSEKELPAAENAVSKLSNWEHSLSHLSTEYSGSAAPLCQLPAMHESSAPSESAIESLLLPVEPLVSSVDVPPGPGSNLPLDEQTMEQTVLVDALTVEEVEKMDAKPTKAPVKFVDYKTVDEKDMELVKAISFSWTDESSVESKEQACAPVSAAKVVSKPMLSFAAIAAIPAKDAVVKTKESKDTDPAVELDHNVVFSTKKPTRKFSKASSLNKTSLCWSFLKNKKCTWGEECIYAHGKKELQPVPKWYKENQTPISSQKNVEPPHSEPCSDHYCRWRRQYLLIKTDLCKLWENKRCPNAAESCKFAHGKSELKPLPKLEMCRLFQSGKCNLKSTECVYAHNKSELRTQMRKKAKKDALSTDSPVLSSSPSGRLRTISEASVSSYDSSWSAVVGSERVRTISGTSLHSNSSQGMRDLEEFDWLAWNSQSEVPAEEELDESWNEDECVICSHEFTDVKPRYFLECEHNFHQKCIKQWLVKNQTCPMCRNPAKVDSPFPDEQWHLE